MVRTTNSQLAEVFSVGWKFWCILGGKYYHNPEKALESLWAILDEMGIYPFAETEEPQIDAIRSEIAVDSIENNHVSNPTEHYNHVKRLLRTEGFDRPLMNKLYVVGLKLLQRELDYIVLEGAEVKFYPDGLDIIEGMPAWMILVE